MPETSNQILKSSKSNFAIAFFGLPQDQRRALEAVYAYCRVVDDIADESTTVAEAQIGLDRWRQALEHPLEMTKYIQSPLSEDLKEIVRRFPKLIPDLIWILDGVEKDLTQTRYKTLDDLLEYCDAVASAVGFCCMTIFGVDRDLSEKYVYATGRALQLTNILRDVADDSKRDRIYIPQTFLVEAGLREQDVLESRYDTGFVHMTETFSKSIESFYKESNDESQKLMLQKIWPAEIMKKTYWNIFKKIQKKRYDVFTQPIKISVFKNYGSRSRNPEINMARTSEENIKMSNNGNSLWDAVVIGAGCSGLACATKLASENKKVLVLEKRNILAGGRVPTQIRKRAKS